MTRVVMTFSMMLMCALHATQALHIAAPESSLLSLRGGKAKPTPVSKQATQSEFGIVTLAASVPKPGLQALALGIFALSFCNDESKTAILSGLWISWMVTDTLLRLSSVAKALRRAVPI